MDFLTVLGVLGYRVPAYMDESDYLALASSAPGASSFERAHLDNLYRARTLLGYIHRFITHYRTPHVDLTYSLHPVRHRQLIADSTDEYVLPGRAFANMIGDPQSTVYPPIHSQIRDLQANQFFWTMASTFSDPSSSRDERLQSLVPAGINYPSMRASFTLPGYPHVLSPTLRMEVYRGLAECPTLRQCLRVGDAHLAQHPQIAPHLQGFLPSELLPASRLLHLPPEAVCQQAPSWVQLQYAHSSTTNPFHQSEQRLTNAHILSSLTGTSNTGQMDPGQVLGALRLVL